MVVEAVEELGQRLAQAAKQINDLIRNFTLEVQTCIKFGKRYSPNAKGHEGYIVTVNQQWRDGDIG